MSRKKQATSNVLLEVPTLLEEGVEIQQSEEELEAEITTIEQRLKAEPNAGSVLGVLSQDPCTGCTYKKNSTACKSCVENK